MCLLAWQLYILWSEKTKLSIVIEEHTGYKYSILEKVSKSTRGFKYRNKLLQTFRRGVTTRKSSCVNARGILPAM